MHTQEEFVRTARETLTHEIAVDSEPSGADVVIDEGAVLGTTPCKVPVEYLADVTYRRKRTYRLTAYHWSPRLDNETISISMPYPAFTSPVRRRARVRLMKAGFTTTERLVSVPLEDAVKVLLEPEDW